MATSEDSPAFIARQPSHATAISKAQNPPQGVQTEEYSGKFHPFMTPRYFTVENLHAKKEATKA
jgi:hypothetical protein